MEFTNDKRGFVIKKSSLSPSEVKEVQRSLTIRPFVPKGFAKEDQDSSYPIFTESDTSLQVPKFWAQDRYKVDIAAQTDSLAEQFMQSTAEASAAFQHNKFNGRLRPGQQEIVDLVLPKIQEKAGGILSASCGQGKTVMAIYLLCHLNVKTLIVVNKATLMLQWKERLAQFAPELAVGTIQQSKIDVDGRHVVVGMLQSLSMKDYPRTLLEQFDFLIVDEVHNIATKTFSKTLQTVCPPYTLGLSATPQRPDGTSKVFHWFLGPMLYRTPTKTSVKVIVEYKIFSEKPSGKFREISNAKGEPLLSVMLSNISELSSRSNKIIETMRVILDRAPTRSVLVLSSRIQQLRNLKTEFDRQTTNKYKTSLYIGSMKQAELQRALVDSQILFGSYELICEGFDYPRLNTLVMVTPRSRIEQAVGRVVRRVDPEIPPLVVDVLDDLPSFRCQGAKRMKYYRKMGYEVIESPL